MERAVDRLCCGLVPASFNGIADVANVNDVSLEGVGGNPSLFWPRDAPAPVNEGARDVVEAQERECECERVWVCECESECECLCECECV